MTYAGIVTLVIIFIAEFTWGDFNCPPRTRPTFTSEAELLAYLDVGIVCNTHDVEIFMDACALISLGYDPLQDLAVGNASATALYEYDVQDDTCKGLKNNNDVLFNFNLSLCDPVITTRELDLVYSLTIRNIAPDNANDIARAAPFIVSFTCTYALTMQASLAHSIYPVLYASPVRMTTQKGEYNVMIALFTNEKFRTPVTAPPGTLPSVEVGNLVFVGLTINTDETYLTLEESECWATYSSDPNDANRYDILYNRCPNPDAEKRGLQHLYSNFNSTTVEVSFRSFTWPKIGKLSQRMYIHCEVSICDWVLDQSCIEKSCPEKTPGKNHKEGRKITKIVTIGPIKVQPKKTECANENGDCTHFCTVDGDGKKVCQCPRHWELDTDGTSCKAIETQNKPREDHHHHKMKKREISSIKRPNSIDTTGYFWIFISLLIVLISVAGVGVALQRIKSRDKGRFDL